MATEDTINGACNCDISITGEPKIYNDKDTESGHTVGRRFCGDCGSAIMSIVVESPDNAFVKGGLFAKSGHAIPPAVVEVYCKSAEKWEKPTEGVQRFQGGAGSVSVA